MTLTFLSIAFVGLCVFDAWFTQRQMHRFGIAVEMNRFIRFLAGIFGEEVGATIGVGAPSLALLSLCLIFHAEIFLALVVGFRSALFVKQVIQLG
jgi:hypothetical protein